MAVLSTAFLPPIEYFARLAEYSVIYLEGCENYQKQSYRNRCYVAGPNGKEMLQIPIVHENGTFKLPIRQIKIDYTMDWVTRMKRAIQTDYSKAAYYSYYIDDIFGILDSRPEKLWDLNLQLIKYFINKLGLSTTVEVTENYGAELMEIHPKKESSYTAKPYFQVFAQKYGFVGNLSILDLLLNEGPESISYL